MDGPSQAGNVWAVQNLPRLDSRSAAGTLPWLGVQGRVEGRVVRERHAEQTKVFFVFHSKVFFAAPGLGL